MTKYFIDKELARQLFQVASGRTEVYEDDLDRTIGVSMVPHGYYGPSGYLFTINGSPTRLYAFLEAPYGNAGYHSITSLVLWGSYKPKEICYFPTYDTSDSSIYNLSLVKGLVSRIRDLFSEEEINRLSVAAQEEMVNAHNNASKA